MTMLRTVGLLRIDEPLTRRGIVSVSTLMAANSHVRQGTDDRPARRAA
jgi:hypothetical protein